MLHWLKQEGEVVVRECLLQQASVSGRMGTLQFLASLPNMNFTADHGSDKACCNAAANRHLQVLQWLHEHGAPLEDEVGDYAAAGGSVPVLSWLAEVLPSEHWTTERLANMLLLAGCYGSLEACIWLRQRGAEWSETLAAEPEFAFKSVWKQCVLDWARANGCTTEHPGFAEHSSEFAQGPLITPDWV
jgi:hypothetical protein